MSPAERLTLENQVAILSALATIASGTSDQSICDGLWGRAASTMEYITDADAKAREMRVALARDGAM